MIGITYVNCLNCRQFERAKGAERLGPKGEGYGQGGPLSSCAACDSPGGLADPTSSYIKSAEHGKPVFLLLRKVGSREAYRRECGQRMPEKANAVL